MIARAAAKLVGRDAATRDGPFGRIGSDMLSQGLATETGQTPLKPFQYGSLAPSR